MAGVQGFGADGPDGGDPGKASAGAPLVGEVEPEAGTGGCFDLVERFVGEESGVADEQGSVGVGEHGDGVGGRGEEVGSVWRNLRKRTCA